MKLLAGERPPADPGPSLKKLSAEERSRIEYQLNSLLAGKLPKLLPPKPPSWSATEAEMARLRAENVELKMQLKLLQDSASPQRPLRLPLAAGFAPNGGCTIEDTAKRGITLRQLREVADEIQRRCLAEGWEGAFTLPDGSFETRKLTPSTTNL